MCHMSHVNCQCLINLLYEVGPNVIVINIHVTLGSSIPQLTYTELQYWVGLQWSLTGCTADFGANKTVFILLIVTHCNHSHFEYN